MQRYKPEQIVTVLRQVEVAVASGETNPQACKEAGITTQSYYRWRKEYGGLKVEQAKRMKELEKEYTRECLALRVARRQNHLDVIDTLSEMMLWRGIPKHIRSDNGPEFVAKQLRAWLQGLGTEPLYIEPGSLWENGYCKSFNGKLQNECLDGEIFYSLKEAQVVIRQWREQYNTVRPHAALGYRPPAPGSYTPAWSPALQPQIVM